jgi:hypothetical protein
VLLMVVFDDARLMAVGIVIGIAASLAAGRSIESALFGLTPGDAAHRRWLSRFSQPCLRLPLTFPPGAPLGWIR